MRRATGRMRHARLLFAAALPILLPAAGPAGRSPLAAPGHDTRIVDPARAPQPFEEDRGQAGTTSGFVSRGAGFVARLDDDGIDLALPVAGEAGRPRAGATRVRLEFLAGRSTEGPAGVERLPGTVDYRVGDDPGGWITGVPTFAAVRFDRLYDGIDLTVRGDHRRLALDFAVAAGADAGAIALDIDAPGLRRLEADAAPEAGGANGLVLAIGKARLRFVPPAETGIAWDGHRLTLEGPGATGPAERVLHLTLERTDEPVAAGDARGAVDGDGHLHLAGRTIAAAFDQASDGATFPATLADLFVISRDRDAITPHRTVYLDRAGAEHTIALGDPAGTESLLLAGTLAPPGAVPAGIGDVTVDPPGRRVVAGFEARDGRRPGRLVQPAPLGGLLFADLLSGTAPEPAAFGCPGTIQFDNGAGTGLWQTPANWDLDRVPDASDDVCIPAGFTVSMGTGSVPVNTVYVASGSSLTVAASGNLSVAADSQVDGTFAQSGGTITGAGRLTVNGAFSWSAGLMTGAGNVDLDGAVAISGSSVKDLSGGRILSTSATTTWSGTGLVRLGTGGVIRNSGTWEAQSNASMALIPGGGPALFENLSGGTFRKTTATGSTLVNVPFDNAGTADVQSGTLDLSAGGSGSGVYQGSPGTILRFSGGTHTLAAGSSLDAATLSVSAGLLDVSGAIAVSTATTVSGGELRLNPAATLASLGTSATLSGGALTLGSGEAIALSTYTQSNGTLQGTDAVTVSGATTWSGGTITGNAAFDADGGLAISGGPVKDLTQRTLNVAGSTTWAGTGLVRLGNGAVVHHSGTWTATTDATMALLAGAAPLFDNQAGATFRKSTGVGTTTINVPFANHGTIDIQSGTFNLSGGGTSDGGFTGSGSGTLRFGDDHTLTAASSIAVPSVRFTGGTIDVSGAYAASASTSIENGTTTFNPAADLTTLGTALGITGGTLNLDSGEPVALDTLTLSTGTLQGSDSITVSGLFTWNSGSMGGSGTTHANGGMAINSSAVHDLLDSRTLNVAGTTTWSSIGQVRLGGSASIRNDGTWDCQADGSMVPLVGGTGGFENRSGATLRKSAGPGISTIGVPITSDGTIEVQSGTLMLRANATINGSTTGAAGGTLRLDSATIAFSPGSSITVPNVSITGANVSFNGSYAPSDSTSISTGSATFNPSATVTGVGATLSITSGTITFDSGEALAVTTLTQADGVLAGSDDLTVSGASTWNGGAMTGAGSTLFMSDLTIGTSQVKDLSAGRQMVTMGGTVTWTGTGSIRLGSGATIHNDGATWVAQSDASMVSIVGINSFINPAGAVFRKSASAGTTTINVPFDSEGLVDIQSGTVAIGGGGVGAGSFTGAPGTTLRFADSYQLSPTSSVAASTVVFAGGTTDVHGAFTVSAGTTSSAGTATFHPDATVAGLGALAIAGTVDLSSGGIVAATSLSLVDGGTLDGSDTLAVSGASTWTGGTMQGTGITNTDGGLALSATSQKDLAGSRRLNTSGATTWSSPTPSSGRIRLSPAAEIHNYGTFDAQSDTSIVRLSASGGLFANEASGLFRKTAGSGTTSLQVAFTNAGTVRAPAGTLAFDAGFTQTAGLLSAEGGLVTASPAFDLQGGTIGGTSTFGSGVVNAGHLSPGLSPGSLAFSGALTQTAASDFDVEIGGLAPGTQHDQAVIGGALALDGTLNVTLVNGFLPQDHDTFTILTFPSATGEFTTFNLPDLGGDLQWIYHRNPTSIVLEALADLDLDGVSNAEDCMPNDPTVWRIPAEASGVAFALDGQSLSWTSLAPQAGTATTYDVVRGLIAELPAGGGASETCLASGTATSPYLDPAVPAPGAGFYYLVRGVNACGIGTYGNQSNGTPRSTPVCP